MDLFVELGFNCSVVAKTRSVISDIALVRSVIPHIYLDASLDFIKDTFIYYSKEWNHSTGVWKDKPKHDVWSNPADAMRNGIIGLSWKVRPQNGTIAWKAPVPITSNVVDGLAL